MQSGLSMYETPPVFICAMPHSATMRVRCCNAMPFWFNTNVRSMLVSCCCRDMKGSIFIALKFSGGQLPCTLWGFHIIETKFRSLAVSNIRCRRAS